MKKLVADLNVLHESSQWMQKRQQQNDQIALQMLSHFQQPSQSSQFFVKLLDILGTMLLWLSPDFLFCVGLFTIIKMVNRII